MGVFRKEPVELQRPDAERQPERHLGAEDMAAEAAKTAFVIALVETGALLEQLRDRIERQQYRDQRGRQHYHDERHDDNARALRLRAAGQHHQRQHGAGGDDQHAPCSA